MTRVVRGIGWLLVVSGVVVLLYVVYLLWFTNFETDRAQRDLARTWEAAVGDVGFALDDPDRDLVPEATAAEDLADDPVEPGDAFAVLWFERDGQPVVADDPLFVVSGVSLADLRAGPGHYPQSDRPGGPGNLAIAGHRTTYGSPFWALDELRDGDTIHVVDRQGREWVYAYREQRIVDPTDVWVVEDDPLGLGPDVPLVTLTTCHPRGSARQRLIAWGELIGDPRPAGGDGQDAEVDGATAGGDAGTPQELPET